MNQKAISQLIAINHSYGVTNPEDMIGTLSRALSVRNDILNGMEGANPAIENDPVALYNYMVANTGSVPWPNKGGQAEFFQFYNACKDLDDEDLLGYIGVALAEMYRVVVPEAVLELYGEFLAGSGPKVLIADGDAFGTCLLRWIRENPDKTFTVSFMSPSIAFAYQMILGHFGNFDGRVSSVYKPDFIQSRFDLIFSLPAFGGKLLDEKSDFLSRDMSLAATENLLYRMNPVSGQLCTVLPGKVTFSTTRDVVLFREFVQEKYGIRDISSLPSGTFYPMASIKTFFFHFTAAPSEGIAVRLFEAERKGGKKGEMTLKEKQKALVFQDELMEMGSWNVDMLFADDDPELNQYRLSSVKKLKIRDVSTRVLRGPVINTRSENGITGIINISDIGEFGVDMGAIWTTDELGKKIDEAILQDDDVLLTARGTTIKVAVFRSDSGTKPCVASPNIIVIRPNSLIMGDFLKLFLESPVGMKLLKSLQRGETVTNINPKDVMDVEVPVPTIAEQKAAVDEYRAGLIQYKTALDTANKAWSAIKADVNSKLYGGNE